MSASRLFPLLLLLLVGCPARADDLFPTDALLGKPVTLTSPRIYLGECLEDLARQTGVSLKAADGRIRISGLPLGVTLRGRPLRGVMEAIQALTSTPFATSSWAKDPAGGYVLSLTPGAGDGLAEIDRKFREDLSKFLAIIREVGTRRIRLMKEHPDLFPGETEQGLHGDLFRALTAEQIRTLIESHEVELRASELPPAAAESLRIGVVIVGQPVPERGKLSWSWSERNWPGPMLSLQSQNGSAGIFGGPRWLNVYLRSRQPGWDYLDPHRLRAFWDRPRDPAKAPLVAEALPSEQVLQRSAQEAGADLIADLSELQGGRHSGPVIYRDPDDVVQYLSWTFRLQHGSSGGVRLLRPLGGIITERPQLIGWPELRAFRDSVSRSGGFLDVPTLFRFGQLSFSQLVGLLPEYESTNINTDQLGERRVWRGILAFFRLLPDADRERVLRGEPIPFSAAPEAARAALKDASEAYHLAVAQKLEANPKALLSLRVEPGTIRVLNQPGQPEMQEGRNLVWEIRYPDGKVTTRKYPLQKLPIRPSS